MVFLFETVGSVVSAGSGFLATELAMSEKHSRRSLSTGGDCCFHFRILRFDFLSEGVIHYAGQVLAIL